jgi:hypothetical protein
LIVSIHDFFGDDKAVDYKPLADQTLEESPCRYIINKDKLLYFCKLHPNVESIYLETIEHHMRYKYPQGHKAEVLRLLLIE